MPGKATAATISRKLRALRNAEDARFLQRYFKTGPGEYAEGDRFLGIRVPVLRKVVTEFQDAGIPEIRQLLRSQWHEERLVALLLMVRRFQKGTPAMRKRIYEMYLRNTRYINNWDLVDLSAEHIVGAWLLDRSRRPLAALARSENVWERRIAVLATHTFIKCSRLGDTLVLADRLMRDEHDLIHKAVGWMLREVGKRDRALLDSYLRLRHSRMPRTMLRYAIEKHPEGERRAWLEGHPLPP